MRVAGGGAGGAAGRAAPAPAGARSTPRAADPPATTAPGCGRRPCRSSTGPRRSPCTAAAAPDAVGTRSSPAVRPATPTRTRPRTPHPSPWGDRRSPTRSARSRSGRSGYTPPPGLIHHGHLRPLAVHIDPNVDRHPGPPSRARTQSALDCPSSELSTEGGQAHIASGQARLF